MHGPFSWGTSETIADELQEYEDVKCINLTRHRKERNAAARVLQRYARVWLSLKKFVPVYVLCASPIWKGDPGKSGVTIDMDHVRVQHFNYFHATIADVFTYMIDRLQLATSDGRTLRTLGMRRINDHGASLAEANKMRSLASAKQGLYYELVV